MMKKTNKTPNKFKMNVSATILLGVVCLLSLGAYVYSLIYEGNITIPAMVESGQFESLYGSLILSDILKNIFLVVFTIAVSSLLSVLLLEKRNNNEIYFDALINDVISDASLFDIMKDTTKKKLLAQLIHKKMNSDSEAVGEMVDSIQTKMAKSGFLFYYDSCEYIIDCIIHSDCIEKRFVRTMYLKSYEPKVKLDNFVFAGTTLEKLDGIEGALFSVSSVKIDNDELRRGIDYEIISEDTTDAMHKKSGYTIKYKCKSKQRIDLQSAKAKKIEIRYVTRVKTTDNFYATSIQQHCRRFFLDFNIQSQDKYDIHTMADGFMDDARSTPNAIGNNSVKFRFNDWIFKGDGVAIGFAKKN